MSAFTPATVAAGFITVLVGFSSSAALVYQAAAAAGATPEQVSSWIGSLGLGMGLTCIGLSLRYRNPVVTAWSTPGAALLATSLVGVPMAEAIGAFLFCALLITVSGVTGRFARIMDRIPLSIASALLAGVLARFGMDVFVALKSQGLLVTVMFLAYLVSRRWWPRYAVLIVLLLGAALAGVLGLLRFAAFELALTTPVFVSPVFTWSTLIGVGIPLFVVTMASQNVTGYAVMRASGYDTPLSPLLTWTGIATFVLAPFGCFALNLAAITAAICMGKEAHEDARKRYGAAVMAGVFYLVVGALGATVGSVFAAFPKELIMAIAGLALVGTIAGGLATAMKAESQREAALITFLVTVSGVSLLGIASAFWGLVAGSIALAVSRRAAAGAVRIPESPEGAKH